MRRNLGTCLSLLACLHTLGFAAPAFADPKADLYAPKDDAHEASAAPKSGTTADLTAKGRDLFDDQRYEESIQTLSGALVRPGNTKEEKIEILRLLALDYITLDRKEEAESAVRGLLVLQPDYELPASESPRFRDFFAAAREKWIAEGKPGTEAPSRSPVTLKHMSPESAEEGHTIELRARLDDPAKRTQKIDLYYRAGTKGNFNKTAARVMGSSVRVQIPGSSVKPPLIDYYFEAYDGAGILVTSRGDASAPLRIAVPESKNGWVLPVAIGGGILGAAAIVGGLALAGVFKSSSGSPPPSGPGTSTVTVSIGQSSR